MSTAFRSVEDWCNGPGMAVNSGKTEAENFSTKVNVAVWYSTQIGKESDMPWSLSGQ